MTLRDWFAGQVLSSFYSNGVQIGMIKQDAELVYKIADEMLKAREATPKKEKPMVQVGHVWKHIPSNSKRYIRSIDDKHVVEEHIGEYEWVCDRPHGDQDFSYMCDSNYCRCCQ